MYAFVASKSSLRHIHKTVISKQNEKNKSHITSNLFGDYEELEYAKAVRTGTLPDNVEVSEFYFKAGEMKNVAGAQRNYISSNYTFVSRDLMINGVNVLAQIVAKKEVDGRTQLSLSCNTDVVLDIMPLVLSSGVRAFFLI